MPDKDSIGFSTPVRHGMAVEIARDEPSHIHIPRPSRPMRHDKFRTPTAEQQARCEADVQFAGNTR